MSGLQFLNTVAFPRALSKLQNWVNFSLFFIIPSPLLRKQRLLLVLNLVK